MKKDRSCGMMPGMQPYGMGMPPMNMGPIPNNMGIPYGYPMPNNNIPNMNIQPDNSNCPGTSASNELEQLQTQVNNLDRRVTRLESMMSDTKSSYGSNKYTDSNYHMM